MDREEQFAALRQCYEDYLDGCRQRAQVSGPMRSLTRLLTGSSAMDRYAMNQFFTALQTLMEDLDHEDPQLAALVSEYMLLTAEGYDSESRLAFQAAESLTLGLLNQLTQENAARILAGYTARYPRRRFLLPKQKEVLAALERAAQA